MNLKSLFELIVRIEELAKKMMSKVDEEMAAKKNVERKRHPSEPTPRFNSIKTILYCSLETTCTYRVCHEF